MIHSWRLQGGSQPQDQVVVLLVLGGIYPSNDYIVIIGRNLVSEKLVEQMHVQVLQIISGICWIKLMWHENNVLALLRCCLCRNS